MRSQLTERANEHLSAYGLSEFPDYLLTDMLTAVISNSHWLLNVSQIPAAQRSPTVTSILRACNCILPHTIIRVPFSPESENPVKSVFDINRILSIAAEDHGPTYTAQLRVPTFQSSQTPAFDASLVGFRTPRGRKSMVPMTPVVQTTRVQTRKIVIIAEDFDAADVTLQCRVVELLSKMQDDELRCCMIATVGGNNTVRLVRQVRTYILGETVLAHPILTTSLITPSPLLTEDEVAGLSELDAVTVNIDLLAYTRDILNNEALDTRTTPGFPARAAQLIVLGAKALAMLRSRRFVIPMDVQDIAYHVMLPRVERQGVLDVMPSAHGDETRSTRSIDSVVERVVREAIDLAPRGGVKRKQPLLDQRKAKELDVIAKAHMYREQRKEVAAEVNDGVANLNEQFVELNKMLHTTGGLQGLLEADEYENGGKSLFGETLNMFEDDESQDEPEPVAAAPVDSYEARFTALLDEYKALFAAGDAPVRSAVADLLERLTACLDEDKAAGTDVLTSIATEATATREAPSTADAALLALGVRLCPHNAAAIAGAAWALSRAVAKLPSKRAPSGGAWTTVRLLLAGLTGAAVGTSVLIPELATALVVLLARSALADDQRAMLTAALDRVVTVYSAGKPANAGTRFDPTRDVAEFRHLSETEVALRTPVPALPVLVAGAGPAVQQAVERVASTRTPLQWQKAMRGEAVVAMAPTIDQTFGSKAEMDNRTLKKHLRKQEKRVGRQLRQEVVGAALAKEEFQQRRAKLADARWGKAQAAMDADIANSKKMVNLKKKLGLGKKG
ncbi:hypothetical protein J8273_3418 [Carpediemonas membranifera]|uniref:magnesium chelatase n=1 Tax=Carpediemonas membranifera TaxID=201153 RepID=A0A8J6AWF1_9EUKA|nr:hypothetical protein J8273_3418 [Carpediemonas membranifera]|eukprot:KAG9393285.1 hypothetical protein J8273_3418 [Carpediemonas membranifera]